jgi:hypothetical protein
VALAQDLFSTAADATEERREEGDEGDAQRPSRPSRVRKAAEDEGQLARMVRELHELEDDIVAKVNAAERLLAQLATRRTHEDGGYPSWSEFEGRMLATCPVLRAIRQSLAATPPPRPSPNAVRRDPADARARQSKALTSMARALERLRGLEAELLQSASEAHSKLHTIEAMHVYDECGYVSFEEFLERALGPSPVLASAVSLVESQPAAEPTAEPLSPTEGISARETADSHDFPPALFTDTAEGSLHAQLPMAPTDELPSDPSTTLDVLPGPSRRATFVVSGILCVAAIVAGAAAGIGSGVLAAKHQSAEPIASAVVPASPATKATGEPPSRTPAGHRAPEQ